MTNPKFLHWFETGNVACALCGDGDFFVPDITYREEHDYVLAVSELLAWATAGHEEDAAQGFLAALGRLISRKQIGAALRLLRTYGILTNETRTALPLNQQVVTDLIASGIREAAIDIAHDPVLRASVSSLIEQFPELKPGLGLN